MTYQCSSAWKTNYDITFIKPTQKPKALDMPGKTVHPRRPNLHKGNGSNQVFEELPSSLNFPSSTFLVSHKDLYPSSQHKAMAIVGNEPWVKVLWFVNGA